MQALFKKVLFWSLGIAIWIALLMLAPAMRSANGTSSTGSFYYNAVCGTGNC